MSQLNDCMLAAVGATGEGQLNDGLRAHYLANGATGTIGDSLQDLEYEFLVANGATPADINDMWAQVLPPVVGFSAQLNDMLLPFWCAGGTFAPPDQPEFVGPIPNQTAFEEAVTTLDCKPYFSTGGFISQWSLIGAPAWITINQSGILRMAPGAGELDEIGLIVVGNNATGPAAQSNAFDVLTPANVAVTFDPKNQFGEIGSEVSFVCQATTATGYQWYKNGQPIVGATGFVYKTPPIVQGDNANEYFCKVEGQGGVSKDTQIARLTTMQKYNNLADGSGVASLVVTLAAGTYTLSMSGSGLTKLYEVTASVIGIG